MRKIKCGMYRDLKDGSLIEVKELPENEGYSYSLPGNNGEIRESAMRKMLKYYEYVEESSDVPA